METERSAWYCARTKAKHEHIAAANVKRNLRLEVFQPQLRVERTTRRGVVRVVEPVFPCYIFIRCAIEKWLHEIQRTNGIITVLHFGNRFPSVPDGAMRQLRDCFGGEGQAGSQSGQSFEDQAVAGLGEFAGQHASVLREMLAGQRIEVLLSMLGSAAPGQIASDVVGRETMRPSGSV
jgi:transcriptional antiterminator RfaH